MGRQIVVIDGHPDASEQRFVHALVEAYKSAAEQAGHAVRVIRLATLDFPLLRGNDEFLKGTPPDVIAKAQQDIAWSNHLVICYPLWLGDMPALLKGFFEQVMRPGFAFEVVMKGGSHKKRLAGKSAHVFVTMGMPGFVYRWYFREHSVKSLERNVLKFVGIKPVRTSIIGAVETMTNRQRIRWIDKACRFARQGN